MTSHHSKCTPHSSSGRVGLDKTRGGKDIVYLIDADTHAYRAAAATDGRYYLIDGFTEEYKYKKNCVIACHTMGLDPKTDISIHYRPEPDTHALKILDESLKEFDGRTAEYFVTGKTNFRYRVAPDYKGNRTGRRPENLSVCKQYLLNKGAKLDEDLEADDLVIIRAKQLDKLNIPWVIVGCDKDLKQIDGHFYDPFKKKSTMVSRGAAKRNLWKQIATGDSTDNIRSVKGIGPKSFDKAFISVDWEQVKDFELLQMMVALYKTKAKKEDGEDDREYLTRILMWIKTVASLVFLRRGKNEEYQLPTKSGKIKRDRGEAI